MSLSLIYARSENHCIGSNGAIPWRLPEDFAHFKRTTMGKPILMGRKTYEDHQSALPGRLNIVISRQPDYQPVAGVVRCADLDSAKALAYQDSEDIFVIGGVSFFVETLASADYVYETVVHANIDGDAFLPAFDFSNWKTELLQEHPADERHAHAFS
ncbi:MAG: dihydrofolate reductase, partial [Spongiibacteraceae bacterium]